MLYVKWLHVLGMVVYVGGFLALTRLMGHAVRFESERSRADAYRIYRRMHVLVDWGGLALMLVSGLVLLLADPWGKDYLRQPYFHVKLTAVVALVLCDAVFSRKLFRLQPGHAQRRAFFSAVHGVAGLALLAALFAIVVMRGAP